MAKVYPNGVTVINIMADGTECDDLRSYLKSPEQLPPLTRRLVAQFIRKGREAAAAAEKEPAGSTE